jgi:hypothetical protein
VLVRRAPDPWESHHRGMMNTIVPEPHIPSHEDRTRRRWCGIWRPFLIWVQLWNLRKGFLYRINIASPKL